MLFELLVSSFRFIENHRAASLIVTLVLLAVYYLLIYPFYISPLKHIPGPYIFRVSELPCLHFQRTNQWISLVHRLHQRYGDVVVLSPYEVSCNGDPKYLNDIYTKNFPKSTFYQNFRNHGNKDNLFASLENERHLNYKKNISNIYSKSAIFNAKNSTRESLTAKVSNLIREINDSSVEGIRPDFINAESEVNIHGYGHHNEDKQWFLKNGKLKNLGIDVYSLFGSLALDVVTAFELGNHNSTDLLSEPENRSIVTYHRYVASMVFYTTLMPKLWKYAATELIMKSLAIIEKWQLGIYNGAEKNIPVFSEGQNLTTLELLKKNGLKGVDAYSFLSDNIFAGHETTAIQLTYLTYELSRPKNSYLQQLLKNELDKTFGKPKSVKDILHDLETIDNLPILNAIILENSRVHASIPGAEPRVVDKNYFVTVGEKKVKIPTNTIISCQPYSMQRVEEIFENPDYFVAERWLKKESETDKQYEDRFKLQQKYMIPFGKGIRMCLGMNIAQIEIKLAVANMYWHFNSKICENWCDIVKYDESVKLPNPIAMDSSNGADKTDEEKMVMFDTYTTRPYNDECWLEWYRN